MAQRQPTARFTRACAAPAEAVYDLLADLRGHLEWAGARQSSAFRLASLDAPEGLAAAGATFSSTGTIPMSGRRWQDRSTVTVAERPSAFELVTEGRAGAMRARYLHSYRITPDGGGCRVTYTLTQLDLVNPMLRLALPGVREMTWRFAIPMFAGRGFRNLLAAAEARQSMTTSRLPRAARSAATTSSRVSAAAKTKPR